GRAGALAGAAILSKLQAVYLLAGVGLVFSLLWLRAAVANVRVRRRGIAEGAEAPPSWRELLQGPLALAGAFAFVTAPHFLKNWVFYNNPMYPFMQDVFASRPTTPHAAYLFEWLFKDYNWRPHGTFFQNVVDAAR